VVLGACGGGGGGNGPGGSSLVYAVHRVEAAVGAAFQLEPTRLGLAGATHTVEPALPLGLSLDITTGAVLGTPQNASTPTTYRVTAGPISTTFELRVSSPTGLLVTASALDGSVLSQGLDATSGATRAVDLVARPAGLPPASDLVASASPPLVAAVHGSAATSGTLVIYDVTLATGALVERGRASLGTGPHKVALSSDASAAYVTDFGGSVVRAFALSMGSAPQPIGTPLATGQGPDALAVITTGGATEVLVIANRGGQSLSSFRIDGATKALTTVNASYSLNSGVPSALAPIGDGETLVVVLENLGLAVTTLVQPDGTLLPGFGGAATGAAPGDVAIDPAGDTVLVANEADGTVTVIAHVPNTTGPALRRREVLAVQPGPTRICIDSTGRFAYVASFATGEVTLLALRPAGSPRVAIIGRSRLRPGVTALTTLSAPSPFARVLANVYVVDEVDATLSVLRPGSSDETLTSPVGPIALGPRPGAARVTADGTQLFVLARDVDRVEVLPLDSQGIPGVSVDTVTASRPIDLALGVGGKLTVVVSEQPPLVTTYRVSGGAMTALDVEALPSAPGHVALDPTGRVIVVSAVTTGEVWSFLVEDDGTLSEPVAALALAGIPRSLAFTPDGRFVVTTLEDQSELAVFAVGVNGSLAAVAPTGANGGRTGGMPLGVAVHPNGRYVLATARAGSAQLGLAGDGALDLFQLNPTSGVTTRQGSTAVGVGPFETRFEPRGLVAYTLAGVGQDLTVLRFDPVDGTLSQRGVVPLGSRPIAIAVRERTP